MRVGNIIGGLAAAGALVLMLLSVNSSGASKAGTPSTTVFVWQGSTTTLAPPDTGPATSTVDTAATATTEPATTTPTESTAPSTTAEPAVAPADLRIRVLGAGSPAGTAKYVSAVLENHGYAPRPTAESNNPIDRTTIVYASGFREEALAAADALSIPASQVASADASDPNWTAFGAGMVDVLVLTGAS